MSSRKRESEQGKRRGRRLLDEVLERRVLLYMVAAGATLTGASAAQAKVVFTPNDKVLRLHTEAQQLDIDLNNDGKTDFRMKDIGGLFTQDGYYFARLEVQGVAGDSVVVGVTRGVTLPLALPNGVKIGSSADFGTNMLGRPPGICQGAVCPHFGSGGGLLVDSFGGGSGNFNDVTDRFLGVRFLINGETHYGWIGFRSVIGFTAQLNGWAYETVPNRPIRAGDRGQGDSATLRSAEPSSLELLAAGNVAMADWRRRRVG